MTFARYKVVVGLCIAASLAYVCRNSISVAESTIRSDLNLTKEQTGWIMAMFSLPYAIAQIPSGGLVQKFGTRICLPLFAVAWSIATLLLGKATGWMMLVSARIGQGLSQAGIFPASTNTISHWFPATERAFPNGALGAFMSIGGAVGMGFAGYLVANPEIGWRGMYAIFSVPGVIFALIFWKWFRNHPNEHKSVNAEELAHIFEGKEEKETTDEATPWKLMFTSPATFWICGQQFCRAAAQIFFSSWFATYLQETRDVSIKDSGLYSMLPLLALVAGTLSGGRLIDWIYKRTGSLKASRQGVSSCSLLICALLIGISFWAKEAGTAVALVSTGVFFAGTAGPSGYTITIDMGGRHVAPLFSTMNMIGNFGALSFIAGTPYLQQYLGWSGVMTVFGCLFLGAAFCWWILDSSGTVFDQSLLKKRTRA